jgi:GNAT superfamily N-acetyltransferase
MIKHELTIETIAPAEALEVVDVLWEAFYDYPVMRFVLGNGLDYDRRIARMIGLFVASRALVNDVMLGVRHSGELIAVATTSDPANPAHPDFAAMREQVWRELGPDAKARYDLCVNAWDAMADDRPQLHVNMLGVRRGHQRGGLASALLQRVHDLTESSGKWEGVSLTTEDPRNVPFYERQGYHIIGQRQVAPELQAWSFFRPNPTAR